MDGGQALQIGLAHVVDAVHARPAHQGNGAAAARTPAFLLVRELVRFALPPARFHGPAAGTVEEHVEGGGHFAKKRPLGRDGGRPQGLDPAVVDIFPHLLRLGHDVPGRHQHGLVQDGRDGVIVEEEIAEDLADEGAVLGFLGHGAPQAAPLGVLDLFFEVVAHLLEVGMQQGFPADHAHHAGEIDQTVNGLTVLVQVHEKRFLMVPDQPRAVGTAIVTGIGHVDLDDFHLRQGNHGVASGQHPPWPDCRADRG